MTLDEYISLLDASGRIVRTDKPGAIPTELAPILRRLSIDTEAWADAVCRTTRRFGTVIGNAAKCAEEAARRCMQRVVSAAPDVGCPPAR